MNDWTHEQECKERCLPNCEEISYDYNKDTSTLDPDTLCAEGTETRKVRFSLLVEPIINSSFSLQPDGPWALYEVRQSHHLSIYRIWGDLKLFAPNPLCLSSFQIRLETTWQHSGRQRALSWAVTSSPEWTGILAYAKQVSTKIKYYILMPNLLVFSVSTAHWPGDYWNWQTRGNWVLKGCQNHLSRHAWHCWYVGKISTLLAFQLSLSKAAPLASSLASAFSVPWKLSIGSIGQYLHSS